VICVLVSDRCCSKASRFDRCVRSAAYVRTWAQKAESNLGIPSQRQCVSTSLFKHSVLGAQRRCPLRQVCSICAHLRPASEEGAGTCTVGLSIFAGQAQRLVHSVQRLCCCLRCMCATEVSKRNKEQAHVIWRRVQSASRYLCLLCGVPCSGAAAAANTQIHSPIESRRVCCLILPNHSSQHTKHGA
jgi:hypothetical protein